MRSRRLQHLTIINTLALIVLVGGLVLARAGISAENGDSQQESVVDRPVMSLRDLNDAFVDLAENVNPAVVTVFTEKVLKVRQDPLFFGDFFSEFFQTPRRQREREFRQQGLGSGVIVSTDGYLLTNNHVIAGADTINVRLLDGRTVPAEVIGSDSKTDIAVLKIDADGLSVIPFGDSDELRVGEWVLAIGSPLSPDLAHSVTSGIVSAKGRSNVGLAEYEDFIQTDAAINPGNSGGALINIDGELVGINTAIASRSGGYQGIGFAVPSNMARHVMESLIEHGQVVRGWLGIYIQEINEALAAGMGLESTDGVLVADLAKDGPAESSGIAQGDVILSLDDTPIGSSAQLRNEIASRPPGSKARITVLRDGKRKEIDVTLAELPSDAGAFDVGGQLQETLGFTVAELTSALAEKYGLRDDLAGVVITSISTGSAAQRAGLKEGDLIVAVNRTPTKSLEEFSSKVGNLTRGDTLFLRVIRESRSFFVAFRL